MKKILGLGILALSIITLASCSNDERIEIKDIYGPAELVGVSKLGTQKVLFKKNSKIPYIELSDGAFLMSSLRKSSLDDDEKYKVEAKAENSNYVVSNETGAKCTISPENQTLTFDDYDNFSYIVPSDQKPVSLTNISAKGKALKNLSSEFTKGNAVTVDLKPYSRLDIYEKDSKCYLPLSVFNSFLYNTNANVNLAYNGKAFFMISSDSLTETNIMGEQELSALGEKFWDGAQVSTLTQEYSEYTYQSMCLDFNYLYGLKKDKYSTFEDFLTKNGFSNDLQGTDPRLLDSYTAVALSYLVDGHTALANVSNMYQFGTGNIDETKMNKEKNDWYKADELFTAARKAKGVKDGIEYYSDASTVFISFKEFTRIEESILYEDGEDDLGAILGVDTKALREKNTAYLFNKLYKDLTSDMYKWTIKNIVVDLSANDGGSADGLLYSLSTLLGNITVDTVNPLTGAHNHQVYKADINADGTIDDKDVPLVNLGFKIYFLDSKYSFSSANAMPLIAKLNNPNVITLGAKTAGGPCAVRYTVTPIGNGISSSSLTTISKLVNGKYVNIDDGVDADFKLTEEQMLDRNYIAENISKWVINN